MKKIISCLILFAFIFAYPLTLFAATAVPVTNVSLSSSSLSMKVGETKSLTASVTPSNATNKEVNWSSDKKAVATVDSSGKVTAKGAGTANITAMAVDGSGKYAKCAVTVTEVPSGPVLVTNVSLSSSSLSMKVGETKSLTASVTPSNASNKGVNWSSDRSAVATVDSNGKVTAKGAGTANITAMAVDGSGKYAKCAVTVSNTSGPQVTSITVNNGNPIILGQNNNLVPIEFTGKADAGIKQVQFYVVKNGTEYLKETIIPPTEKFKPWDISYTTPGTYQVKIVLTDSNNAKGELSKTVEVKQIVSVDKPQIKSSDVTPEEGIAGSQFTFTAKVSNKPDLVYIQFDDGEGDWLSKDTCKSNFAMQLKSSSSNEGTYALAKTISTSGQPSTYQRKYRVWAENTAGETNKEGYFVVKPSSTSGPQVNSIIVNNGNPIILGQNNNLVPIGFTGKADAGIRQVQFYVVKNDTEYLKETISPPTEKFQPWDISYTTPGTYQVKIVLTDLTNTKGELSKTVEVKQVGETTDKPQITSYNVAPKEASVGSQFTFTAKVSNKPDLVYIQFDDGEGDWLSKDTCKSNFAMQLKSSSSNEGTYALAKTISTSGQPSTYQRKYRVWAENTAGETNKEGYFVVKPSSTSGPQVNSIIVNNGNPIILGQNNNLVPIGFTGKADAGIRQVQFYVVKNDTEYLKETISPPTEKFQPWDISYTTPGTYQVKIVLTDLTNTKGELSKTVEVKQVGETTDKPQITSYNVAPKEASVGSQFTFTAKVSNKPDLVYIVASHVI
ncbi:Ig-like domain-containing protein [Pelotomaculum isophthalicicum JI]|uniref:Ig-like domain-containing protein n=1 Tax=Pelotomaculum isophthalicicum JI TaxID=947010 RepID=A0A9X4GYT0_9FIRM|nr:Ig-like domain-containing protein [Pelotomaculum isophthalicicum]MDF9408092.1 Ig-like domain-containing protein [Pelotomaculum isophthalicicum JI]